MFRKPLVRGLALVAIAGLALLGTAAAVVCHWVKVDADSRQSLDAVVPAKLLGWKVTDGDSNDFARQVAHNPLPVLQLLTHDSHRIRRWAEQMLLYHSNITAGVDDKLLNAISTELVKTSEYDKPTLFRILANVGERGVNRLMLLYRSNLPVAPPIQREICSEVRRVYSHYELIDALLSVAKDDALTLENRRLAVEALGFMRKPDDPGPVNDPARESITKLTDLLPQLPETLATAARLSLHQINHADEDDDGFLGNPIISPAKDGGVDALAALEDKGDWLRVGYASEALARHGVTTALPNLQNVADTHWYAPVRKTALQAIRILHGQEPAPAKIRAGIIEQFVQQEIEATHRVKATIPRPPKPWLSPAVTSYLQKVQAACFWRFQPKIKDVEYHAPGRLPVLGVIDDFGMNPMKPRHAIRFAGGKLLGYNEGEFGAGTVFYRKGETPLLFDTSNVDDFLRTPFGVLVICEVAMMGDGFLYLASEQADGRVSVNMFMRLPNYFGWPTLLPSGETVLRSTHRNIVISRTGEIQMTEKPAP